MNRKWILSVLVVASVFFLYNIFSPLLKGENPLKMGLDISGGVIVDYSPDFSQLLEDYKKYSDKELLEITKQILQSRLYRKLKISPDIVLKGDDTIRVSIPNVKNPNKVLDVVGQTFHLTFRLVLKEYKNDNKTKSLHYYNNNFLELSDAVFSGSMLDLDKIKVAFGERGDAQVEIAFKSPYDKKFEDFTKNHIGRRLAILIDENIEMAPVIKTGITGGVGVITGNYSDTEARDTAMLLRSGSLPVSLKLESMRAIGPTLGEKVKESGTIALLLSLIAICCLLAIAYMQRVWLLISGITSLFFLIFSILGLISLSDFTLDIGAIAGAILIIGMGMDAFLIIFESLEIRLRNFSSHEISNYYSRIIRQIYSFRGDGRVLLHSNLTTLIAILPILYIERLRFLALFIILGLSASILTIFFTREVLNFTSILSPKSGFSLLGWLRGSRLNLFKFRTAYLIFSSVICIATLFIISLSFFNNDYLKLGGEFRPGTQVLIELEKSTDIMQLIDSIEADIPSIKIIYQKQNSFGQNSMGSDQIRYLLTINKPIYAVQKAQSQDEIDDSIKKDNGLFTPGKLYSIFDKKSVSIIDIDSIGSKLSAKNTMVGLSVIFLSFISIALYFLLFQNYIDSIFTTPQYDESEDSYGNFENNRPKSNIFTSLGIISAVIHDVLIILFFCWLLKIEITLPVIAAILTMIGYSVNDSVVLWSHIQNLYKMKSSSDYQISFENIIGKAIDSVLSRTLLTSISTLIPAFSILLSGINELYSFCIVICVGTISGTLSSIFIVGSFSLKALKNSIRRSEEEPTGDKVSEPVLSNEEFEKRMGIY